MLAKLIYILFLILLVLFSIKLTNYITKKIRVNRWIVGFLAFLVLIIPRIVFENISPSVWNALLIISAVLCMMFFEITRQMLENEEYIGIIRVKNDKIKS